MSLKLGSTSINKAYLGSTEIKKMYLGTDVVFDDATEPVVLKPIMTNFRVEDGTETRVYFDTPLGSVAGISASDFTISGKTITGVTIVSASLGYFTVSSAFNYAQKGRTIKKEGSDTTVYNFTMQHISNEISEPTHTRERFVSVSGGGDGTSTSSEWTWSQMLSNYAAGDLIHVRAGNYGTTTTTFPRSGDVSSPVVIQGYKTNPGDITSTYWDASTSAPFTTSEMPSFNSGNRFTGTCFTLTSRNYITLRNFQISEYNEGVFTSGSNGIILDRILGQKFGDTDDHIPVGTNGLGIHTKGIDNSYLNCKILDSAYASFRTMKVDNGSSIPAYHLTDNCEAWMIETDGANAVIRTDYYFSIQAHNVVTKNSIAHRVGPEAHHGHGISFDDGDFGVHNCLTEDCLIVNIKQGLDQDLEVVDNVYRNIECQDGGYGGQSGGVKFSANSRDCIFENCVIGGGLNDACLGWDSVSGGDHSGNRFDNCLFYSNGTLCGTSSQSQSSSFNNCTFDNVVNLGSSLNSSNTFTNCLFNDCTVNGSSAVFTNCNSYNGFALTGTNLPSVDPMFVDGIPTNKDLVRVAVLSDVRYDIQSIERQDITTIGKDEIADAVPPEPNLNLIENGTFDNNDTTGWILQTGWAITNNRLESTATTTLMTYDIPTTLVDGDWYELTLDAEITTEGVAFRLGGSGNQGFVVTSGTGKTVMLQSSGTENKLRIDEVNNNVPQSGNFDNFVLLHKPDYIVSYTTTTSSLGMVENNEAESLANANKLIAGLNSTPDGVTVDGTYFIETPGTALTATDIRLSSINGGELKSNVANTGLFTSQGINNIEIDGVTFSDVFSGGGIYKLFYYEPISVESVNLIKINSSTFNGNIYVYLKDWGRITDPSTYKVGSFIITNNYINNNRSAPFKLIDVPIDVCTIVNNTTHNFDGVIFSMGISNDHTDESAIYTLRPLFTVTDNITTNDVDWQGTNTLSSYFTNCIFEANQVDYLSNYTEGIWTTQDRAVYDAYLSCSIVNYKNNINKNNIAFNSVTNENNTLIKMKGAADDYIVPKRYIEDNQFTTEESWIDAVVLEGADKQYASVNFAQTGVENTNPTSTFMKNNTFDIYSMIGKQDFSVYAVDYEISGNTFNLGLHNGVFTERLVLNDNNVANSVVFSDNIFNVGGINDTETFPSMVKFQDERTTNTDKVGSIVVNNNSGTVINQLFFYDYDTESFTMTGNTFTTNAPTVSYPYVWRETYNEISSISNNVITFNTGVYFIGNNDYAASNTINESIIFNGTPQTSAGNDFRLRKGMPQSADATYTRTYTVDDGNEIYDLVFTLSYDTDHWNVSFQDFGGTPRTFQMNNNDGVTDGNYTQVQLVDSGTSNTSTEVRFFNTDSWSGFSQTFTNTDIKLDLTTIKT